LLVVSSKLLKEWASKLLLFIAILTNIPNLYKWQIKLIVLEITPQQKAISTPKKSSKLLFNQGARPYILASDFCLKMLSLLTNAQKKA
jgi:hypothetical protein